MKLHLVQPVELSREPHFNTPYNCLRHYVIDDPKGPKMRVKALKVRDAFPQKRCLGKLVGPLADKWHLAQEHPHIAPMGFCRATESGLQPVLDPLPVVILMREYENGNILEHINRVGALYSQRAQWLLEAVSALQFLHEALGVNHGNVHPNNILIDGTGRALLADSALYTSIRRYFGTDGTFPHFHLPASLWCKPARVIEGEFRCTDPTEYEDIFGFSVTIWMVFSGEEPFRWYDSRQAVIFISESGHGHLKKAPGMSDGIWELIRAILQDLTNSPPSLRSLALELEKLASAPGNKAALVT